MFPEIGRGLCHVTNTIFDIRSKICPKLLELETSNLVGGLVLGMPSRRTNNFLESGRGLGHVTPTILAVRSAILATAWLLVIIMRPYSERRIKRCTSSVVPCLRFSRNKKDL